MALHERSHVQVSHKSLSGLGVLGVHLGLLFSYISASARSFCARRSISAGLVNKLASSSQLSSGTLLGTLDMLQKCLGGDNRLEVTGTVQAMALLRASLAYSLRLMTPRCLISSRLRALVSR